MRSLLIILVLCGNTIKAQKDTIETPRLCNQYELILDYIKSDTTSIKQYQVDSIRFRISKDIFYAPIFGSIIFDRQIILYDSGISQSDFMNMEREKRSEIYNEYFQKEQEKDTTGYFSSCLAELSEEENANVLVVFYRFSEDIVTVHTRRIFEFPRYSRGIEFLFFFEKDNTYIVEKELWLQ